MDDQLERLMTELWTDIAAATRANDKWVKRGDTGSADAAKIASEKAFATRATLRSYLSEDTRRLDWLEDYQDGFHNIDRISSVNGSFNRLPSLRIAIDAAMRVPADV